MPSIIIADVKEFDKAGWDPEKMMEQNKKMKAFLGELKINVVKKD